MLTLESNLPALPNQFRRAAIALPSKIRESLPSIVTLEAALDADAKADATRGI